MSLALNHNFLFVYQEGKVFGVAKFCFNLSWMVIGKERRTKMHQSRKQIATYTVQDTAEIAFTKPTRDITKFENMYSFSKKSCKLRTLE